MQGNGAKLTFGHNTNIRLVTSILTMNAGMPLRHHMCGCGSSIVMEMCQISDISDISLISVYISVISVISVIIF